ncbi:hypothetical protein FB45DRAFT_1124604 [Roridomyces roridus]|uniref:Uncharacterized protein n=1 Tax=Roridomyces roridus TaxID=1738132 RepID=A0AAD7C7C6_9AGAR|nr:hypothetical protein FB45DRAFT_1124604 [Roridomyces roridus]
MDNDKTEWFPWPDKETCVLDILRHIPRCSFSKKQNAAIHWAMSALGVHDLPSDRVMDDIDKALQPLCGIQSIRYSGKLNHVYYVNDLAAIIAQEMANPSVREKLHFLPEDTRPSLSQAWQASRWRHELDPDLATPMIRIGAQDFFTLEPTVLRDGTICMPSRWFKRGTDTWAEVWMMRQFNLNGVPGWLVDNQTTYEIKSSDLLVSFPDFINTYVHRGVPDPRIIHGENNPATFTDWTSTDPSKGNRWRLQAAGHRVVSFPVWLYCDDTSGNMSKKWNKHNSFLFTAAGLPRKYVHQESNIHFLSTSNIAPPLEMLDGIVEQLQACQEKGIWAWDSHYHELVLVIPSVLAMLGDNPMQSEFACHIGFRGKLFCRACWVQGDPDIDDEEDGDGNHSDASSQSGASDGGSTHPPGKKKPKKKKKSLQTVPELISRVRQFMQTCNVLRSQFTVSSLVGGQAQYKRNKTAAGIKDTYQEHFLARVFALSTKRGRSKVQKQADVNALLRTFPADITSPVWRIKDFDPHQDTPVEILHVILLGFVKYFWRDAIARLKKPAEKELLIARLSSFNVSGLGFPALSGHTLVNYAGSLTGRDFRALVQAAPFVLQGLLPKEKIHAWTALSAVVSLVWQPEIENLDKYTTELEAAIDHFLDCTCRLSLNWFNKPKFHVILHLPNHIRRFGPAMLFATEGFESFNAIIRACSIHSNRHAPSRDIAAQMARGNRVRHLLSGGFFRRNVQPEPSTRPPGDKSKPKVLPPSSSPWMKLTPAELQDARWVTASNKRLQLLELNSFGSGLLGFQAEEAPVIAVHTPEIVTLGNGDMCRVGDSVVYDNTTTTGTYRCIGRVVEIVQVIGSPAERSGKADLVLVARTVVGEPHDLYCMRRVEETTVCEMVDIKNIKCTVNVQHNCADHGCKPSRSKKVYQEREETSERDLALDHHSTSDCIVNTGQMRDAAVLQPFRAPLQRLAREDEIRSAAELEFQARRTKAAALAAAAAEKSKAQGPSRPAPPGPTAHAPPPLTLSSLRNVLNDDPSTHPCLHNYRPATSRKALARGNQHKIRPNALPQI